MNIELYISGRRHKDGREVWEAWRREGNFGWSLGFKFPNRELAERLALAVAEVTGAKYVGEEK